MSRCFYGEYKEKAGAKEKSELLLAPILVHQIVLSDAVVQPRNLLELVITERNSCTFGIRLCPIFFRYAESLYRNGNRGQYGELASRHAS